MYRWQNLRVHVEMSAGTMVIVASLEEFYGFFGRVEILE